MSHAHNIILLAAAGAAAIVAGLAGGDSPGDPTPLVSIVNVSFDYRQSGEYLRDGVPVDAPLTPVTFARPLVIMQRAVSAAEYRRCVEAAACRAVDEPTPGAADTVPVIGVSWNDATDYAAWLSRTTGHRYRLPTDAEWAFAAGERFRDDALGVTGDANDPARRWLAAYEKEAAEGKGDPDPAPHGFGTFGVNANGLVDAGGNVWEWTDSCFVRHTAQADGGATMVANCGVRIAEGRHRAYISDFIRNPRGGACSVGVPPSNLGIRLVRDDGEGFLAGLAVLGRRVVIGSGAAFFAKSTER